MMRAAVAFALVVACHGAQADQFTQADIIRQSAITGLLMIDQGRTQQIREFVESGSHQHAEANPVIRKHFSEPGIRNYFVGVAVGSAVIARALPKEWRPAYQYGVIAYELVVVIKNKRAGLHFRF